MPEWPSHRIPAGVRYADLKLRVYQAVRQRVGARFNLAPRGFGSGTGFGNLPLQGELIVYFGDEPDRLYQLEQWLPVFERLHKTHPVLLLTRNPTTLRELRDRTPLPAVFIRYLRDLNDAIQRNDFKVAMYVNNSWLNFQALMFSDVLHLHLNHGESDKASMSSNQSKAYDRVLVAGQAAVDRYRNNVFEFDVDKVVAVGRPQLDVECPSPLGPSDRPTVLYAPTWEGERDAMNYTSLDVFGVDIVEQLLATGEYRVIYKPHPRVADEGASTAAADQAIKRAIRTASESDPSGGHRVLMSGQIHGLFAHCDAMITDVSSVGLDFLYLAADKPLLLTDRFSDADALLAGAPVAAGSYLIDAATVAQTATILADALRSDPRRDDRARIRGYYFGDLQPGQSTDRFLAAVRDAVAAQRRWSARRGRVVAHHPLQAPTIGAGP